jgi:YbbR domain-containing protein
MMARLGQNLGTKLLSLACSFALFLYVHKQQASELTVNVPLAIRNDPSTRVIEDAAVRRAISVTLSGPADQLKALEGQVKAVADLTGQGSGTFRASIRVTLPEEDRNQVDLSWYPRSATVRLEGQAQRRLAVQSEFNVQPPAGMTLSDKRVEPATVVVTGWESAVRRVRQLQAVVNSLPGGTAISLTVGVRALDARGAEVGEEIQLHPPTIKVSAQLRRSIWFKPVYVSPTLGDVPAAVRLQRVSITPARLTVRGPEDAVGRVEYLETEPILIPATPGVVDREVRVIVPPGVTTAEPRRVRVVIALQGASS